MYINECQEPAIGLYDPAYERDACGVGYVVSIDGQPSHKILCDAQTMLCRMEHRGATGCDNDTGDGAGVMTAIPHKLYRRMVDTTLPPEGQYGTGILFMDKQRASRCEVMFTDVARSCDLQVLCWRTVPTNDGVCGRVAQKVEPLMRQVFVGSKSPLSPEEFGRQVYLLRKQATHSIQKEGLRFYICSLSNQTIVYKGLLSTSQLWQYFPDLADPDYETHLAIVHSRFSTNTVPSWERAHPQRYLAHNGEINTLRGNVNLMNAREGVMSSPYFGPELTKLYPVVEQGMSDSGSVDNVLEFLCMASSRSLPEAVMTMVPEAWQNDDLMPQNKKNFYRWSAFNMEPWDGPALFTFSDGRYVGAILDRNGLRPSRFMVTTDKIMYMSSEVGVVDIEPQKIVQKGRLKPGRMLLVDTKEKIFKADIQLKSEIADACPYGQWLDEESFTMDDVYQDHDPKKRLKRTPSIGHITDYEGSAMEEDRRLVMFGWTAEVITMLLEPMIKSNKEALGSMGNDAPLACLSLHNPRVFDYFQQLFAQVTNPPIDPFREKIVMSLECPVGPEANLLDPGRGQCKRLWLAQPTLSRKDLKILKQTSFRGWRTKVISIVWPVSEGPAGLVPALKNVCHQAAQATRDGFQLVVLSDQVAGKEHVPIPSLLAMGATHHHLVKERLRGRVGIIVETGEAREVHDLCTLLGFGADAICPYMVWETATTLRRQNKLDPLLEGKEIYQNYVGAVARGISKVMAKMGISTLHSYKGAQIFEAVGLHKEVIDLCFVGTASRLSGATFEVLAIESLNRHNYAYSSRVCDNKMVITPGYYQWRDGGEKHMNDPNTVAYMQEAARNNSPQSYRQFADSAYEVTRRCTIRGQLDFNWSQDPVDLDEVEPAASIIRRFVTGAMSFGSISFEAHSTLAIAMNKIGGKSNTGEGGENAERYRDQDPDRNMRSAIKQVASGRFGVTSSYLSHADELQIKMAQGAKPGEGGELPGYKVSKEIAATRHSIPGVGLISPPPHHDIYSIEDLAELIYDLKSANPNARISVKLVSEVGVGIVASGVAKGKAEHITISGHDGGTGASSWTGIKHAGLPWELGISETHQTLTLNDLRSRVVLQADGQMRTGRDVVMAALLGADEVGFSTAPLIVMGCTMMRKCHLNTCPVGIATQDPELRKKFTGQAEHVINYFFLVAEEVREIMSRLGIRKFQDLVGRTDKLRHVPVSHNVKAELLDLKPILKSALEQRPNTNIVGGSVQQEFNIAKRLDLRVYDLAKDVIEGQSTHVDINLDVCSADRTFGATLSYYISMRYGEAGLPDDSVFIRLTGSGGQSFCAFLAKGVTVELEGDSNDYVGKGLSGGKVIIYPPRAMSSTFNTVDNIIVGNVVLYGATSGLAYFRGQAAERFCVRNSGAVAVCEGCGDHGCEYMTGGRAVILGLTGRNFAAGMSGGLAFIYNVIKDFEGKCNMESVDLEPVVLLEDEVWLRDILIDFNLRTGSIIAKFIVDNWQQEKQKFVKVFPHEYRRALHELALEEVKEEEENEQTEYDEDVIKSDDQLKTKGAVFDIVEDEDDLLEDAVQSLNLEEDVMTNGVVDIEDVIGDKMAAEKSLDKTRGFIKYRRATYQYRKALERMKDWGEIYNHTMVKSGLRMQAARCMDCGVPFCQSDNGCPLGNIIPKWNDLVFRGHWKEALHTLLQTNNFPEFTGRACPAPCEGACVLGINEPPVTIKNIENAIIDHAFEQGWIHPHPPEHRTHKSVCIVGSGPSGLAAAAQLNKAGHDVTVYERKDRIGGLLTYGIPTMKLGKDVVQRRIDLMADEGIKFEANVEIGKTVSARKILSDFDAVLLCMGATWPRDLPIPGRQLGGIHFAMSFLETWQRAQATDRGLEDLAALAKDKNVVVIGGGDTGCDCIATSLRQGAQSVTAFEILPTPPPARAQDNPWPTWPKVFRVDYGHEEVKVKWGQDPRVFNILSKEFVGNEQGHVTGVKTTLVKWTKDDSGRWTMTELPDTEKVYPCDLVLLAMGFLGPESDVIEELKLNRDPRSNILTPRGKYSTSVPRVYAAGDCRRGQSLVVHAINEGRQAAREVDIDLMGQTSLAGPGGIVTSRVRLQGSGIEVN